MLTLSLLLISYLSLVHAQLSGSVGPLVDYATKARNKTCDITDYGAVADGTTDISTALVDAWNDCKNGGLVYIPPGTYSLVNYVELKDGTSTAIQLDGTIQRGGGGGYQMILIRGVTDFELFSGNSQGALQGFGYENLENGTYGVRFMRIQDVSDFSVHGIAAVDSPSYYFVFDTVANGEIYNVIIRGVTQLGETDGIDIWGQNVWVHDVEVTNGDECVTVKSPAHDMLIESIYCNLSGGTAIGSLGEGTDISDIHYRNLYMNGADACYLKTNNGDGSVSNVLWENVIVHGGPYPLALNEGWGSDVGSTGVQLSNLTFRNWYGENTNSGRAVIRLECDPDVPCYDITLDNVNLWTEDGDYVVWTCQNAYGSGACLKAADGTDDLATYTTASTITKAPSYSATTMADDFTTPPPSTTAFSIPPIPTSFYPGVKPISALLDLDSAGGL